MDKSLSGRHCNHVHIAFPMNHGAVVSGNNEEGAIEADVKDG